MPFIEKFEEKARAKDDDEKIPSKNPEPTFKEILANEKESRLFGDYLKNLDADSASEGLKDDIKPDDLEVIVKQRKEFLAIRERTKEVQLRISGYEISKMIAVSPELKKVSELTSVDDIHEIMLRHLDEMAFSDPERFKQLEDQVKLHTEASQRIEKTNKEIEELCKENGFTQDEYMEALQKNDLSELDALVKSKLGIFGKLVTREKSIQEKGDELDKSAEIKKLLASLNEARGQLGGVLQKTLFDNETMRGALIANIVDEKIPQQKSFTEAAASFSSAKKEVFDNPIKNKEIREEYKTWMESHKDEEGFNEEEAPAKFSKEYVSKKPKKKGFWTSFFGNIFAKEVQTILK